MSDAHMDAKVLRRAAEIVPMGWCQGALRQGDRVCLLEAVRVAYAEIFGTKPPGLFVAEPLWRALCDAVKIPVAWNDKPERTADEVIALLNLAADRCDGVSRVPHAPPDALPGDGREG